MLKQLVHARIAARALQLLLVDHDHRLIEHIVQLVLIEGCSHRLSVAQRGPVPSLELPQHAEFYGDDRRACRDQTATSASRNSPKHLLAMELEDEVIAALEAP